MTEAGKLEPEKKTEAVEPAAATPVAEAAPVVPPTIPKKKSGIKRPAAATPAAPAAAAAPKVEEQAAPTPPKKKKTAAPVEAPVQEATPATTKGSTEKYKQFGYKDGNILMKISPTKLIVEIDLTQRLGRSQSGKSEIIARTAGVAGMEIPGLPGKQLQVQCYDTGVKRKAAFDEIG